MEPKPNLSYSLDADLFKILADAAGGAVEEAETPPLDARVMERFTTENARLEKDAVGVFPESPWYLVILIVALMGVLVNFLFLIR